MRELSLELMTSLCENAPDAIQQRGASMVQEVVPLAIRMLAHKGRRRGYGGPGPTEDIQSCRYVLAVTTHMLTLLLPLNYTSSCEQQCCYAQGRSVRFGLIERSAVIGYAHLKRV